MAFEMGCSAKTRFLGFWVISRSGIASESFALPHTGLLAKRTMPLAPIDVLHLFILWSAVVIATPFPADVGCSGTSLEVVSSACAPSSYLTLKGLAKQALRFVL